MAASRRAADALEDGAVEYAGRRIVYSIRRSTRRRTIGLAVTAEALVRVAAPPWVSRAAIAGYVSEKAAWILRHQLRVQSTATAAVERRFAAGDILPVLDETLGLHYSAPTGGLPPQVRRESGLLVVRGIPATHVDEAARQAAVRRVLEDWYRAQALAYFTERCAYYCTQLGRAPARVSIGSAERRWGSCSSRGTLRFNWRLLLAPAALADYVAAHEVAHLVELNHSLRFWRVVARLMPDFKRRQRELDELASRLVL